MAFSFYMFVFVCVFVPLSVCVFGILIVIVFIHDCALKKTAKNHTQSFRKWRRIYRFPSAIKCMYDYVYNDLNLWWKNCNLWKKNLWDGGRLLEIQTDTNWLMIIRCLKNLIVSDFSYIHTIEYWIWWSIIQVQIFLNEVLTLYLNKSNKIKIKPQFGLTTIDIFDKNKCEWENKQNNQMKMNYW